MIWTSLVAQGKRRLWMSLLVSILIALVYLHFARFYQGRAASWLFTLGWIPVGLNVLRAGLGLVYRLDRHPFAALDLGLVEDRAPPGGSFELEIRAEPRRSAELELLAVELRCTRHEIQESRRVTSVLHDEVETLAEGEPMEPGTRRSYRASLPVPPDAPFSFRSLEGKIRWALYVRARVEDWGELADEIEVLVAPG